MKKYEPAIVLFISLSIALIVVLLFAYIIWPEPEDKINNDFVFSDIRSKVSTTPELKPFVQERVKDGELTYREYGEIKEKHQELKITTLGN